jgi:hypothetical protein
MNLFGCQRGSNRRLRHSGSAKVNYSRLFYV